MLMNLGKLLFAGRSVVSGCETISYHENKQVVLPKFVSAKNPFGPARAPAETAPAPAKKPAASPVATAPKLPPVSRDAKIPAGLDNQIESGFAVERRGAGGAKNIARRADGAFVGHRKSGPQRLERCGRGSGADQIAPGGSRSAGGVANEKFLGDFGRAAFESDRAIDNGRAGLPVGRTRGSASLTIKKCAVPEFIHRPVMAAEVLAALKPRPGGRYADGTVGGAGHAASILAASSPTGWLSGCDRDGVAVEAAAKRLAE